MGGITACRSRTVNKSVVVDKTQFITIGHLSELPDKIQFLIHFKKDAKSHQTVHAD
jgi:hypothetical protein